MNADTRARQFDDLENVTPPAETRALYGHDAALALIAENYRRGRLHHAWLITGPRGIGKATLGFRLAAHILRHPIAGEAPPHPQHVDDPVKAQISKSGHPGLIHLSRPFDQKTKKFKTQITVEEIRRAAAFLQKTGGTGWRIVILDPADDLNRSAANALLKNLEEPPARTIFFILAHSPRGLLPTLRSRCQLLPLKPLVRADLSNVLAEQQLTAQLAPGAIDRLIGYAGGSARRALQLADGRALGLFEDFLTNLEKQRPDIGALYALASQLAPVARENDYRLFLDLVFAHLAEQTRAGALNDQIPLARLKRWTDIWQEMREASERADLWNMDRKQVIVDVFTRMRDGWANTNPGIGPA